MKQILFVEDNDVLRDMYPQMLAQDVDCPWKASTAPDAATALRLMGQSDFDVVVSDMQMPGMNGIELLTEIRISHPRTTRIIISGINDQAVVANTLNCTHLFIPKPFDGKTLKAALDRVSSLDAYLKNERLRNLASMMSLLPSFPVIYLKIIQEVESPHSSIQGVAKIITQDPGITAKILQVANSAVFGLSQTISDPAEAVQQLGMSTVRSLALSAQVYSAMSAPPPKLFSPDALWSHLSRCAGLASRIVRHQRRDTSETEEAFTAGMLHDMGLLMLAHSLPHEFEQVLSLCAEEKIPLRDAEIEIFGATHAGLAAYLFGLWGLPASIVEAVAFHQTPELSDLHTFSPLTAVHVANVLCEESPSDQLNLDYLSKLGVADQLENWQELALAFKNNPSN